MARFYGIVLAGGIIYGAANTAYNYYETGEFNLNPLPEWSSGIYSIFANTELTSHIVDAYNYVTDSTTWKYTVGFLTGALYFTWDWGSWMVTEPFHQVIDPDSELNSFFNEYISPASGMLITIGLGIVLDRTVFKNVEFADSMSNKFSSISTAASTFSTWAYNHISPKAILLTLKETFYHDPTEFLFLYFSGQQAEDSLVGPRDFVNFILSTLNIPALINGLLSVWESIEERATKKAMDEFGQKSGNKETEKTAQSVKVQEALQQFCDKHKDLCQDNKVIDQAAEKVFCNEHQELCQDGVIQHDDL